MITENYNDYKDGGTHKEFTLSVVGEQTEIGNTNLMSESIKLEEALCSENNLRFGCCEASQFTAQIANEFTSLEGKYVDVSVEMDTAVTKYGTFKIVSDKPTADRIWRVIKGYDKMYDILNADVLAWYNGLTFPMTLKNFRDSFFTYLGITQETVTLINDSFQVQQGFSATGSLSGKTIITAICEFNGVFGHINRDGNFEYVSLDSASSFNCPPYENNSVTYEDYVTETITKVTMRGTTSDVGTSVGVDGNEYIITNNPLIYGTEGTQALTTALTNLLNKISQITFRPFSLGKTIGNPCVELGDAIVISTKYQTINSYVIKRVLSGIQALRDSYSATGNKIYPKEVNTIQSQINRLQGKTNELEITVDGTVSTVTRVEQIAENAQETADGLADDVATANQNAQTALNNSNRAIVTDTLHYLATSQGSGVTTATTGWTTTPQSVTATDKYLWTYHTYTYADSHTADTTPVISGVYGDTGAKGDKGEDGDDGTSVSITSTSVTYQTSTSGTTVPTGTWQSSVPTVAQGSYLWTRTIVNYSNSTSTTSYSVSYQGQNGDKGDSGKGIPIFRSSYQSVTTAQITSWSKKALDTWAMVQAPVDANGNTLNIDEPFYAQVHCSTDNKDYAILLHVRETYTINSSGGASVPTKNAQGYYQIGQQGANGTSVSISDTSVTYQVSNSGTTTPTGTWQSSPQATSTGQYLWTRTIVNYSNGTSTTSYSVSAHGQTGATGTGISEVTPLYYASNSATVPSAPTSAVTSTSTTSYNAWTKGVPSLTTTYKYMFTCDQVKYTNNTFAWTTPVLDNALSTAVSEIKQMADQIVLKVDSNGNIVKVALTADASTGTNFKVSADNISFIANGVIDLTADSLAVKTTNFNMDQNGNITVNGNSMLNIIGGSYGPNSPGVAISSSGLGTYSTVITPAYLHLKNYDRLVYLYECEIDGSTLTLSYEDETIMEGDYYELKANHQGINLLNISDSVQTTLFSVSSTGQIKSNSLTASKILVSDTNKNIVSSSLAVSDLITTSNIGSQSVNYATSAGSATNATYINPLATGRASNPNDGNSIVIFKRVTSSEAPNNGVVLEFGNSASWRGQLYIGDNSTQGIAWNGWANGTRGSWLTFLHTGNYTNYCIRSYAESGSFNKVAHILEFTSSNNYLGATSKGNYLWGVSAWSDIRLKKNIKDSEVNALDLINKIQMREFDFKDEKFGTHKDIGYVAQELMEVIPECVEEVELPDEDKEKYGAESMYQVEDKHMIPYLVKAIQEQQRQIQELKQSNSFYQNIILQMQVEIEQIKQKTEE